MKKMIGAISFLVGVMIFASTSLASTISLKPGTSIQRDNDTIICDGGVHSSSKNLPLANNKCFCHTNNWANGIATSLVSYEVLAKQGDDLRMADSSNTRLNEFWGNNQMTDCKKAIQEDPRCQ
jgi:hypothetical protein